MRFASCTPGSQAVQRRPCHSPLLYEHLFAIYMANRCSIARVNVACDSLIKSPIFPAVSCPPGQIPPVETAEAPDSSAGARSASSRSRARRIRCSRTRVAHTSGQRIVGMVVGVCDLSVGHPDHDFARSSPDQAPSTGRDRRPRCRRCPTGRSPPPSSDRRAPSSWASVP